MQRSGIVLAGTVILDIVHLVDRWPEQESVAFVSRTEYGAGGPPQNAAAGLKKLQAPFPVTLQGALGDDAYADVFAAQSAAYGLGTGKLVRVKGAVTSHTQVMTTIGTGRRTFFHQPGVNAVLAPEMLLPETDRAKMFYVGAPGIAKAMDDGAHWAQVMKAAKARGFITALELVPLEESILARLVPPILPYTDVFAVNDHEAACVTGMAVAPDGKFDWTAAERACHRLLEMGVGLIAAIHHPAGAVAVRTSGEMVRSPSVKVPDNDIAGTVGAGDAFFAGLLLGLHEEWPLDECLALANASAATSLQSVTTSASIRPWQECLAYARQHGLRDMPAI